MGTTRDDALRQRLAAYMASKSKKSTRQRELIFECFLGLDRHVSLQELLDRVQDRDPGVGYATVYRTMKLLTEAGVAEERHFGEGMARWEPADLDEHHDHLICTTCGHIFEFEDELIESRQHQVADAHGLVIQRHRHEIYGACREPVGCPRNASSS